jgi:signal peptidase II
MSKVSMWLRRAWIVLLVAGSVIALDQWTKAWVRATIPNLGDTLYIPGMGDYFLFEHVHNYGAAFGILQNWGGLFVVVAAVVTVAILVYVWHIPTDQTLLRVLLGLQMGGAIGNVIDRLHQGYVTDFVKTGIPGFYYIPNYNIADSAIVVGVISLGIYIIVEDVRQQRSARRSQADISTDPPAATTHPDAS